MNKIIVLILGAFIMVNTNAAQKEVCAEIQAIGMIAKYESFRSDWYRCSANKRTIGYGFTDSVLTKEELKLTSMTRQQADRILGREVRTILRQIKPLIKAELTETQRAVCVSLVWNIGLPNFKNSTFLKRINEHASDAEIIAGLKMWNKIRQKNKDTGKMELVVCEGLVNRRAREARAWLA